MGDTDVKRKMLTFKGPIDIGLKYVKNICQSVTYSLNCVSNSEIFTVFCCNTMLTMLSEV